MLSTVLYYGQPFQSNSPQTPLTAKSINFVYHTIHFRLGSPFTRSLSLLATAKPIIAKATTPFARALLARVLLRQRLCANDFGPSSRSGFARIFMIYRSNTHQPHLQLL